MAENRRQPAPKRTRHPLRLGRITRNQLGRPPLRRRPSERRRRTLLGPPRIQRAEHPPCRRLQKPLRNALVRHPALYRIQPAGRRTLQPSIRRTGRLFRPSERQMAHRAQREPYLETLSRRTHGGTLRRPHAVSGRNPDIRRIEKLAAVRRRGLVARHHARSGTGFRAQRRSAGRVQNLFRRPRPARQSALLPP